MVHSLWYVLGSYLGCMEIATLLHCQPNLQPSQGPFKTSVNGMDVENICAVL